MALVPDVVSFLVSLALGIPASAVRSYRIFRTDCCLGNRRNRAFFNRSWRRFRPIREFGKEGVFWRWSSSVFLGCCPRHFSTPTYLVQFIKISEFKVGQLIIHASFRTLRWDENLFAESCCDIIVAKSPPEGSLEFGPISPLIIADLEPQ